MKCLICKLGELAMVPREPDDLVVWDCHACCSRFHGAIIDEITRLRLLESGIVEPLRRWHAEGLTVEIHAPARYGVRKINQVMISTRGGDWRRPHGYGLTLGDAFADALKTEEEHKRKPEALAAAQAAESNPNGT